MYSFGPHKRCRQECNQVAENLSDGACDRCSKPVTDWQTMFTQTVKTERSKLAAAPIRTAPGTKPRSPQGHRSRSSGDLNSGSFCTPGRKATPYRLSFRGRFINAALRAVPPLKRLHPFLSQQYRKFRMTLIYCPSRVKSWHKLTSLVNQGHFCLYKVR